MEKLSESQKRIIKALTQADKISYDELTRITGLSSDGVRGRVSELGKKGFNIQRLKEGSVTMLKYFASKVDREFEDLGTNIKIPQKTNENDFSDIQKFIESMRKNTAKHKTKRKDFKKKCGFLVLSDLHFGEIVREGHSIVFDTAIAHKRMEQLTVETLLLLKEQKISQLYVALIGDMVDGDSIYKNHMFEIEKAAIEQVKDSTRALITMFNSFLAVGVQLQVGCVRGNHGITNYKNLVVDNWDNVVYDMLQLVFDDKPNVTIDHFQTEQAKISVLDREAVLYHGQELGGQIKTASGIRDFRGLCGKHKLSDGDFIVVGHLHQFGIECDQGKFLFRNGSLPNASDYALRYNLYSVPVQLLLVLEEKVDYPTIYPIQLE